MHEFLVESAYRDYHEYKYIIGLKDQILLQLGDRHTYVFKIDIFAPEFVSQVFTHAHANFLSGKQALQKWRCFYCKVLNNSISE